MLECHAPFVSGVTKRCATVRIPNHLFQLLAMIGMEPPISFDADAVRAKKTELLQAIHPISPENSIRGQYGSGGRSVDSRVIGRSPTSRPIPELKHTWRSSSASITGDGRGAILFAHWQATVDRGKTGQRILIASAAACPQVFSQRSSAGDPLGDRLNGVALRKGMSPLSIRKD